MDKPPVIISEIYMKITVRIEAKNIETYPLSKGYKAGITKKTIIYQIGVSSNILVLIVVASTPTLSIAVIRNIIAKRNIRILPRVFP